MPTIKIKVKNPDRIRYAFGVSPAKMTKELNLALRKAVITIEAASRRNTPVLTGRLRASTYVRFGNLSGVVGTKTNYDVFVHEGTRHMRARPYLRMAVEDNKVNIDRFFNAAVNNTLDYVAKLT